MAELTTIKNSYPELTPVNVADESKGHEALASVFGDIAKISTNEAISIKKEQSDVMLMDRQNQAYEIANKAKVEALRNPDQGDQIANNAHQLFNSLYNGLNEKQAQKLRNSIDVHAGGMDLEIARATARQNKIQVKMEFANTFAGQIQAMKNDFDPESLKQKYQLAFDALNTQLSLGMRQQEYQHYKKLLDYSLEYHQGLNDMMKSGNLSAEKLASMQAISINNEMGNNADHPIDQTTKLLYDTHTNERSYSAAQTLAGRGIFPNLNNLSSLSPAHFHSVVETYQGAMQAKGFINSNGDIRQAKLNYDRLKVQARHTPKEQGQLEYYKTIFDNLGNDEFLNIQSQTNAGQQISQDYVQNVTAINNAVYKGTAEEQEAQKNNLLNQQKSKFIDDHIALARAQHYPTPIVQPIDEDTIRAAKSGFEVNGDPDTTLKTSYSLPKHLNYWLSKTINDPKTGKTNRNEALYVVGLLREDGKQPSQFQKDLIISNRDKIDTSVLKFGNSKEEKETHGTVIRSNVIAQLTPVLSFLGIQPEGNQVNQGYAEGLTDAGMNYVKYQMIKNGDFHGENGEKYAKEFADHVKDGYKIYKNHFGEFNLNEINITPAQADVLSTHVLQNFREGMLNKLLKSGLSENEARKQVSEAFDTNPLMVRNTRDGYIVVMDSQGAVVHSELLTSHMHASANERHKNMNEGE